MFDRDDDPRYLQTRLESFIDRWHGRRKPWSGIAAEKITQTLLPKPLAWLYGYAGEWHGRHYWNTLLGNQDQLVPFEELSISDGKLVFVVENQGVWQVATERTGDDPPVWARLDEEPWQLLDDSLTRFLVTFVLHETVFGCQHLALSENVIARFEDGGMHVSPLWLNHPYPAFIDGSVGRPISYHVAQGRYLIMDDAWCATNIESPWQALPDVFEPRQGPARSAGFSPYDPMPDHLQVPSYLRASHLQNAIRLHEEEIEYHQERCDLYRQMLADIEADQTD